MIMSNDSILGHLDFFEFSANEFKKVPCIEHDKKSNGNRFPDFIVRYPKNRAPEKEKSDPKPPKPQN